MTAKQYIVVAIATIVMCVFMLWMYVSSSVQNAPVINSECYNVRDNSAFIPQGKHDERETLGYIHQRNNISRLLNIKQKINAQNECEVIFLVIYIN